MTFNGVPVHRLGTLFLCLLLLGQAGCFQQHEPADFVVINGPDPESLDPAIITSQADGRIVSALFEGLTRFNAVTAQAEPALAKRWEISGDGAVYTFHLRDGLQWSTGESITAHYNLAIALHALGHRDEAWTHFRHVIRINPALGDKIGKEFGVPGD